MVHILDCCSRNRDGLGRCGLAETVIADTETYWSVLSSPAHLLAELTVTAVTDGLLYPLVRLAVKRHDRKVHS